MTLSNATCGISQPDIEDSCLCQLEETAEEHPKSEGEKSSFEGKEESSESSEEDKSKEKKKEGEEAPPPPHGDKTPWQVFTETLRSEFKADQLVFVVLAAAWRFKVTLVTLFALFHPRALFLVVVRQAAAAGTAEFRATAKRACARGRPHFGA